MKILFVAATEEEIAVVRKINSAHSLEFLVTGPGMVATTYVLTKRLSEKKYDLVVNIGLAGSFDRSLQIGEVINVTEDIFSELGAEDGNKFIGIADMGLNAQSEFYPTARFSDAFFKQVRSITVNTVHGEEKSIAGISQRLKPQTETMEGAAFFFVCEKENVASLQLRAISNYVEKRNKPAWNIPLALENLGKAIEIILHKIKGMDSITTLTKDQNRQSQSSNRFSLGISPCPNDTFIFDALINNRIDNREIAFDVCYEDVETLNNRALRSELDIVKISFAAYSALADNYQLLSAGSALGKGVGPLLISKKEIKNIADIQRVAIPGKNTTANFLFNMFYPQITGRKEMVFSEIEAAVLNEEVDAGVIIHENRFTYAEKGLKKISDLGELWEVKTHQPIPLGGIAVRRSLPEDVKQKINKLVGESVKYAFEHPEASYDFVKLHAQEMSAEVRKKHIALYVNNFSENLGKTGRDSIIEFLKIKGNSAALSKINEIFISGE